MKKLIFLIPIIALAIGCDNSQQGLEEKVYTPTINSNIEQESSTTSAQIIKAKVAVIALDDNGKNGTKIGCNDSVVFVEKSVHSGVEPLNSAIRALFQLETQIVLDTNSDKEYYNVIPKMENLKFDHATLENGLAKIYLTGSSVGLDGVCDTPRVPAQIEGTAKQVESVQSIEVYVNDKKISWQEFDSQK